MLSAYWGVIVWLAILCTFGSMAARGRDPSQRPLAAFLIFALTFTAISTFVSLAIFWLAGVFDRVDLFRSLIGALAFMMVAFGPAAIIAYRQARKPRKKSPSL